MLKRLAGIASVCFLAGCTGGSTSATNHDDGATARDDAFGSATGGIMGTGGSMSTGGSMGSGGATSAGGTTASGGSTISVASGGSAGGTSSIASGGSMTAGGATTGVSGGATGTGGVVKTGGASGAAGGGTTGSGGKTGSASAGGSTGAGGIAATGGAKTTGGATATGGGTAATGGTTGAAGGGGSGQLDGVTCTPQTWDANPIGWATQSGGTTGGGNAAPTVVTSLGAFNSAAAGTATAVIHVSGKISGIAKVGSNKTILGLCGAEIDGSLDLSGSSNVIVRNLKVVGYNCTDSPSDCSSGSDAVHVQGGDKHLWFDHMDISDGSDGNLDITHGCDFITISWTKFHYSSKRTDPIEGANGHRFCNLIGHDDSNGAEDSGHLNVTFHHVWWADNVSERMPRVRFGKVHVFNSLYTAVGDSACIEVGVSCNIRSEENVFQGVTNTVDSSHADSASIIQSIGNQGSSTDIGGAAFTPPYPYTPDAVTSVAAAVQAGAGPK